MKTIIFFNTFVKMKGYDFNALNLENIRKIAFVAANEYESFINYYNDFFEKIIPIEIENGTLNYPQSRNKLNNILSNIQDKSSVHLICLSEDNLLLVAQLREDFKLEGMSIAKTEKFRDKVKMKDALRKAGILLPTYEEIDSTKVNNLEEYYEELVKRLGKKIVIKPKALLGAMGVSIINNLDEFIIAMKNIENYYHYEVESFISGTLFHIDSILANGKTVFQVCCEYSCPNFDFQLGKSLLSIPLPTGHSVTQQAKNLATKVLNTLEYQNGASHLEFFINEKKQAVFLEIAARTPGAMLTPTYYEMFNFNMLNADLALHLGLPLSTPDIPKQHYFSGLFPTQEGEVIKLAEPKISGKYEMNWRVKVGDKLKACKSLRDIASTIIAYNESFDSAYEDFKYLAKFNVLDLK